MAPGYLHTAHAAGTEEEIHSLPTYVTAGEPNRGIIVIISDMFGWQLPNTRLLADRIRRETGATVYVPDFLAGDSVPTEHLELVGEPEGEPGFMEKAKWNFRRVQAFGPWLVRHRDAVSLPIVTAFFEALYKEDRTRTVMVAGYSWGGRYALLLTHRNQWMMSNGGGYREGGFVNAAFVAHPTLLSVPSDITAIARPTSLALGDCDEVMGIKTVEQIQKLLEGKAASPEEVQTEVHVYEGALHGFAVRADLGKVMDKEHYEGAAKQAVEWFKKFL
ncbi:Alpha/Beta hydrolase protein [Tricharina praecox]|uniref:Alpha/Beta hydrolase protein n=1 Tax=Tricharina praecox TaxID=43433 RepID=UPI002220868F|nr:Alpha/Beta hydrolase protein [Tricharina praecox]KAI5850622.1 Alpha/Beta hydrolase protein [Tricharina praecox]